MNTTVRILIILVLLAYISWRVWGRIQGAKQYVEADSDARMAWKEGFQELQKDRRFLKLKQYTESHIKLTLDTPTDDAFQLVYATVMDANGANFALQDIEQGTFLIIYVKGAQGRKQFALDLRDESVSSTDLGAFAFRSVVPSWAT